MEAKGEEQRVVPVIRNVKAPSRAVCIRRVDVT